jgi:hypothetical protein
MGLTVIRSAAPGPDPTSQHLPRVTFAGSDALDAETHGDRIPGIRKEVRLRAEFMLDRGVEAASSAVGVRVGWGVSRAGMAARESAAAFGTSIFTVS